MADTLTVTGAETATDAGLVYVGDESLGMRRLRKGKTFVYVTHDGKPVRDEKVLARIRKLAIPPAYEDVWICGNPRGHLQATGRDARGRKQYRYHPHWRVARDCVKFARMGEFGAALPRLRRRVIRDTRQSGLARDKVVATVVRLLDMTLARIGNDEYARTNGSFGLTTLRNRHVRFVRAGGLQLIFRGKGGIEHEIRVDDQRLARIVRRCHQLPGHRLFQFVDDGGERRPVDSGDVNEYLRKATGADFTAKDFRTWGATLRAAQLLARVPVPEGPGAKARETEVVRAVAGELGNTPAVCRNSYINPAVFVAWRNGQLHRAFDRSRSSDRQLRGFLEYVSRLHRVPSP